MAIGCWLFGVGCSAQTWTLEAKNDTLSQLVLTTDSTTSRWRLPYEVYRFKNYKGHVRPLWMGSKLGGELHDFRFIDGRVRSLEASINGLFAVAEYEWSGFGLSFVKFIVKGIDKDAALKIFEK